MPHTVCLEYFCPECGHGFKAEVWTIVNCQKCGAKIETDWFDDEYAGMLGECRVISKQK